MLSFLCEDQIHWRLNLLMLKVVVVSVTFTDCRVQPNYLSSPHTSSMKAGTSSFSSSCIELKSVLKTFSSSSSTHCLFFFWVGLFHE